MKKRFFLTMIFLVLLVGIFTVWGKEEKYYNTQINKTMITARVLNFQQDKALKKVNLVFIVPVIFFFVTCLSVSLQRAEFEIGTVVWKPKYQKQLPRGNLV